MIMRSTATYFLLIALSVSASVTWAQNRQDSTTSWKSNDRGTHFTHDPAEQLTKQEHISQLRELALELDPLSAAKERNSLLQQISELQLSLKQYDQSLATYSQILESPYQEETRDAHISAHQALAFLRSSRGEYDQSLRHLRVLISLLPSDDYHELSIIHSQLAQTYLSMGAVDSAWIAASTCLEFAEQDGKDWLIGKAYNSQGLITVRLEDYSLSTEYFLQAIEHFRSTNKPFHLVPVYNNIASSFARQGNYHRAHEYAIQALEIADSANFITYRARSLRVLAEIAQSRDSLDKAETLYTEARQDFLQSNIHVSASECARAVALLYRQRDNPEGMQRYLKYAEEDALETDDVLNHYFNRLLRARYQLLIGKSAFAQMRARDLYQEAIALDDSEAKLGALKLWEDASLQQQIYPVAYRARYQIDSIEQALFAAKDLQIMHFLENRFQRREKEIEIQELSAAQSRLESSLAKRRAWLQRLMILGAALALIIVVGYYLLRKQRRLTRQVTAQSQVISQSLEEKDLLLREIHHRVKNNLQVVNSLLSLQSRSIDDPDVQRALRDGQNRVKSMALIHQNLYKDVERLDAVDAGNYIKKLSESLFRSYNVDGNQVILETRVDDVRLDIDLIIPLGLILNELISNSLKHAFPDDRPGTLAISLDQSAATTTLTVADDGVGVPADKLDMDQSGFGQNLIRNFARKLKADLSTSHLHGTRTTLIFPSA